ncbi:MAG: Smr/MutS family protein [Bacteroidota bacterium]|nr:Smr/MutS family protein [Bacteroidota bacterium]
MLKLGDKVRFVNEKMEGIITSLKGKNLVGVTVDSDFEIPVLISELLKIDFDNNSENSEQEITKKPERVSNNNPLGIFMAFERFAESKLQLHFHNNFTDEVVMVIYQKEAGVFKRVQKIVLERDETKSMNEYDLNHFEQWNPMHIHILCIENTCTRLIEPISFSITFQPKAFHQTWRHCFFLNKQAYVIRIDEKLEPLNLNKLKEKDFSEKQSVQPIDLKARPANIIDLHYEALVAAGYGSGVDITGLQMEVFTQTLESAFVHKMNEIVYIHGVGNMYLKNKIRTFLSKQTDIVKGFEDADIIKYGGGATMVFLK